MSLYCDRFPQLRHPTPRAAETEQTPRVSPLGLSTEVTTAPEEAASSFQPDRRGADARCGETGGEEPREGKQSGTPPLLTRRSFRFSRLKTSTAPFTLFLPAPVRVKLLPTAGGPRGRPDRARPPPPALTRSLCRHFAAERTWSEALSSGVPSREATPFDSPAKLRLRETSEARPPSRLP